MDIVEDKNIRKENKQDSFRLHFGDRSYETTLLTTIPRRISF